jgi:hypothetical protein
MDGMDGACSTNGGEEECNRVLVGKPEGKRPLEKPRRRWVDNIEMDLGEIKWDGVGWIDMAQDRGKWRAFVKTVLNLRVPYNAGKSGVQFSSVLCSRM